MTEADFISSIDCQFPYADKHKAIGIIRQSTHISANASFAILHELVRLPKSVEVQLFHIAELMDVWESEVKHPLNSVIFPIAKQINQNERVSCKTVLNAMGEIAKHPNQLSALAIAYFACDDVSGEVDRKYNRVIQSWQAI